MRFDFEATGIGSVPFKDPKSSCRIIFDNFKTIPFWPQLPKRSFLENMYAQYSERLPGLVLDEKNMTIHIDTSRVAHDIEETYARYLDGGLEYFKISEDYAEGFYEFLEFLKEGDKKIKFVKGQVTGPISFGLFLTDQNKRAVIYDRDLFEILTKVLSMKARWQIRRLKEHFKNVIIFIDEPYLVSVGSSFVNINMEEATKHLDELVDSIKKEGALVGIHCCGNTDWSILLKRGIDILNFDTYNFMKEFSLYAADIKNFLKSGGTIGWGIVPSSDAIDGETKGTLIEKLKNAMKLLTDKGIEKNSLSSIITPSCGVGTLDEDRAKKILEYTKILSSKL